MNAACTASLILALASTAAAQSIVYGVDVRGDQTFASDTGDFVANYTELAADDRRFFGLDFSADGLSLYAVDSDTFLVYTIDLNTGEASPTGVAIGGLAVGTLTGLTADPDGSTWYLSCYNGTDSLLYRGNIQTGVFTLIGNMGTPFFIDISMSPEGRLFGLDIDSDSLFEIDTGSASTSLVGGVGLNVNFAQGMDFDPTTGELFAALYLGGGQGLLASLNTFTGVASTVAFTTSLDVELEIAIRPIVAPVIGTYYCTANPNSTGVPGEIVAQGSTDVLDNNLNLTARNLPQFSFGFMITSDTPQFTANPAGSAGNLCIGGSIGRFVGPGQIQSSGALGRFAIPVDLTAVPQPNGPVAAVAGDRWYFQAWYRDSSPAGPTSNFTQGVQIIF